MSLKRRKIIDLDAKQIHALHRSLGLTQQGLAEKLGTRQQTISDWERGIYKPRGTSSTLLTIIAEQASFKYEAGSALEQPSSGSDK